MKSHPSLNIILPPVTLVEHNHGEQYRTSSTSKSTSVSLGSILLNRFSRGAKSAVLITSAFRGLKHKM